MGFDVRLNGSGVLDRVGIGSAHALHGFWNGEVVQRAEFVRREAGSEVETSFDDGGNRVGDDGGDE